MAEPKPLEYVAGTWTGRGRPKPVTIADLPTGGGEVAWTDVTGKPTTFAPTIGTTATTALAGNTTIPAAATWANISGKPAVVAAGADAAAARTAIGAGTSNLTLAQSQAGIATKAAIAALTPESTLEDVIAALQA